jgi:hypothetical protein
VKGSKERDGRGVAAEETGWQAQRSSETQKGQGRPPNHGTATR